VFATLLTDDGRRGEDLLPICDVGQDTLESSSAPQSRQTRRRLMNATSMTDFPIV
jgi:hypothetical protein